jgi:hypothetical protein
MKVQRNAGVGSQDINVREKSIDEVGEFDIMFKKIEAALRMGISAREVRLRLRRLTTYLHRTAKLGVKLSLGPQETGHEVVEYAPQLQHVVLRSKQVGTQKQKIKPQTQKRK